MRGFNPRYGYDSSPPPPPSAAPPGQQWRYVPPSSSNAPNMRYVFRPYGSTAAPPSYSASVPYGWTPAIPIPPPPPAQLQPQPPPPPPPPPHAGLFDSGACNFLFPRESVRVNVLMSPTAPWDTPATSPIPIRPTLVPCAVSVGDFMHEMGCTNADPAKNILHELVPVPRAGGSGSAWSKARVVAANNKDAVAKTLKAFGWTKDRSGLPGEKPPVYVWLTKG